MDFETRIKNLLKENKNQQAIQLSKAVIHNSSSINVKVRENSREIFVETDYFKGTHKIGENKYGTIEIDSAEYECTIENVGITVEIINTSFLLNYVQINDEEDNDDEEGEKDNTNSLFRIIPLQVF